MTMWFEFFTALGATGIAGFAVLSDVMARMDRRYSARLRRIEEHLKSGEARDALWLYVGQRLDPQEPWVAAELDSSEVLIPEEPLDQLMMNRVGDENLAVVNDKGLSFPGRLARGKGVRFEWWPRHLDPGERPGRGWRPMKRLEPVLRKVGSSGEPPFGGMFTARLVFAEAADQIRLWRRFRVAAMVRTGAITMTASGGAGALIAVFWT